jgi:hypothetical protein
MDVKELEEHGHCQRHAENMVNLVGLSGQNTLENYPA